MSFFNFNNSDGDALFIDGEITSEGNWWAPDSSVVARKFRQQLQRCGDVTVYINSPGGDVFAGAEIYTMLREHPGKVTVKISGIAASAASIIAMAGDEILISPVGHIMIHDPWTFCAGNARDLEKQAAVLREVTKGIINAYRLRTGKSEEELRALLESETYMSADTAIREGFADGMLYGEDIISECERQTKAATDGAGGTMMRAKNYAPAAILNRMRAAAGDACGQIGVSSITDAEAERRAEIARRAETIKNLF